MGNSTDNDIAVLIVDDEAPIRKMVRRIILQDGHTCFLAANGQEALTLLDETPMDVVITDIAMPVMDGIELTKQIRQHHDADVIMMTGYYQDLTYKDAIAQGASDFIQKPFVVEEFQIRLSRVLRERKIRADLRQSLQQVQEILDGVIHSLSSTVEARDPYTSGHQKRVAWLSVSIAGHMNLPPQRIRGIRMAAMIHDLGKIALPAEILSKPSRLSDIEFSLIKNHPEVGYDILKDIPFPMPIADIIYQHHERLDGSGYPRGLKSHEIHQEAKIIAVADVVEAMSSHRPYRPALGIDMAIREISENRGRFYDPDSVDACLKSISIDGLHPMWLA